jgi:hypothetical protein
VGYTVRLLPCPVSLLRPLLLMVVYVCGAGGCHDLIVFGVSSVLVVSSLWTSGTLVVVVLDVTFLSCVNDVCGWRPQVLTSCCGLDGQIIWVVFTGFGLANVICV